MRTRRTFKPEFKTRVVLECFSGEKSVSEACREHQLNQSAVLLLVSFAPAFRYYYGTCLAGIRLLRCVFIPNKYARDENCQSDKP